MSEERYFVVTQALDGKDVHGHWFRFEPGQVYEATLVASTYLVARDPEKASREIYLRLRSPWWWQRVKFSPATLDMAALLP